MKKIAILSILPGSQRILGKDFYLILGVPLYKIIAEKILNSGVFDHLVIQTDNKSKVLNQCSELNIEVFHRSSPEHYLALTEETLKKVKLTYNLREDDWVCLFKDTYPFIEKEYLKKLSNIIEMGQARTILTCVGQKRYQIDEIRGSNFISSMMENKSEILFESGMFWATRMDASLSNKAGTIDHLELVKINAEHDIDIDTLENPRAIKTTLEHSLLSSRNNYRKRTVDEVEYKRYYEKPTDPDGRQRDLLNEYQERLDFAKDEILYLKRVLVDYRFEEKIEVLDVGCGTGVISSNIFEDYSCNIIGIEPDNDAADLAKTRVDTVHCSLYEGIIDTIRPSSVDFVLAFHVIEHVPDPNHFLDNVYRVLKPGGYFLLSTPDFEGPIAKKYGDKFRLLHDPTHTSLFGLTGLINSTLSRGFYLENVMQPFLDTKWMTKENLAKLFEPELLVSPAFTGNVVSLILRK